MSMNCTPYREQIPRLIADDLGPAEQKALEVHLAECSGCKREHDMYEATLRNLRLMDDVPLPRHFFVYPESGRTPWSLFRQMTPLWQGIMAVTAVLVIAFVGSAMAGLQVRTEGGTFVASFGAVPPPAVVAPPPPVIDTAALQDAILRVAEERNRRDMIEWLRTVRAEIARSQTKFGREQSAILQTALIELETRMTNRLAATADTIETGTGKSLAALYQTVTLDRERDLSSLNERLERAAESGEVRSRQTDAILETLLQVAEIRLK